MLPFPALLLPPLLAAAPSAKLATVPASIRESVAAAERIAVGIAPASEYVSDDGPLGAVRVERDLLPGGGPAIARFFSDVGDYPQERRSIFFLAGRPGDDRLSALLAVATTAEEPAVAAAIDDERGRGPIWIDLEGDGPSLDLVVTNRGDRSIAIPTFGGDARYLGMYVVDLAIEVPAEGGGWKAVRTVAPVGPVRSLPGPGAVTLKPGAAWHATLSIDDWLPARVVTTTLAGSLRVRATWDPSSYPATRANGLDESRARSAWHPIYLVRP